MRFRREQLQLYLVMGSTNCKQSPLEVLAQAIQGGISIFQFREKGKHSLQGEEKVQLAKNLKKICELHKIPFIVNDDVELALSIGADGVHVGQEDGDLSYIKRQLTDKIVGISTHSVEEAIIAENMGADYIGVGPMYPTKTKSDTREVCGPKMIERIRKAGVQLPIVGIGGITFENAGQVFQAGADGVAVISAITGNSNVLEATHKLTMVEK